MASTSRTIVVEVAYATAARQMIYKLHVAGGTTVEQAIRLSGVLEAFPEIDLSRQALGVFGERVRPDDRLHPGDRIEIYRPLVADSKQARKRRAAASAGPPRRR